MKTVTFTKDYDYQHYEDAIFRGYTAYKAGMSLPVADDVAAKAAEAGVLAPDPEPPAA